MQLLIVVLSSSQPVKELAECAAKPTTIVKTAGNGSNSENLAHNAGMLVVAGGGDVEV